MLKNRIEDSYTFDDLLLLHGHSKVLPPEVSVKSRLTQTLDCNTPFLSAAVYTVTEHKTAINMTQEGGIGIIHKNMCEEKQVTQVNLVKRPESGTISDPITVEPEELMRDVLNLMKQYRISGVPVKQGNKLIDILTNRDLRFETNYDQPVVALMTGGREHLITVSPSIGVHEAKLLLHKYRIEKLLVVSADYEIVGLITFKDTEKARKYPDSSKDDQECLRVGAALSTSTDLLSRANILIDARVDVVVLDTSIGHSQVVLDSITKLRSTFADLQIICGNIATGEEAEALIKSGVDAVKVGIGRGSICKTRIVASIGNPQITAINKVSCAFRKTDIPIIADRGIKYSGDIVKAFAIGAHTVMIGSLFVRTTESPGQVLIYKGRRYKIYPVMGLNGAMKKGNRNRYFQSHIEEDVKFLPEGIEGRITYRGHLSESIYQFAAGLGVGRGYTGSTSIRALRTKPRFVKITAAGLQESHAHNIFITEEAPNYRMKVK